MSDGRRKLKYPVTACRWCNKRRRNASDDQEYCNTRHATPLVEQATVATARIHEREQQRG